MSENEMVKRLTQGDEIAFEKLYGLYSKRLYGNIIKLVKAKDLADELLQDVFIKLWDSRQQIDPDQSFRSYLFRIAHNHVIDFFRKASRDQKLQDIIIANSTISYQHVEQDYCSKENEMLLQNLIGNLPPRRAQIFQLVKIEGMTYNEVGRRFNISTGTINDHIVKATKFIRERLKTEQMDMVNVILIVFLLS